MGLRGIFLAKFFPYILPQILHKCRTGSAKGAAIDKMLAIVMQNVIAALSNTTLGHGNDPLRTAHMPACSPHGLCHFHLTALHKSSNITAKHFDLLPGAKGVIGESELDHLLLRYKNSIVIIELYLGADHIPIDRGLRDPPNVSPCFQCRQ